MSSMKPMESQATSWLIEEEGCWVQHFPYATVTIDWVGQEEATNDQ